MSWLLPNMDGWMFNNVGLSKEWRDIKILGSLLATLRIQNNRHFIEKPQELNPGKKNNKVDKVLQG